MSIQYDPTIKQYVARDLEGREVYGDTFTDCALRVGEANRVIHEHRAKNPTEEQIVLEVEGYARGRQLLNKRLARVRVNGGSYRKAKDPNFDNALAWLMGEGYELAETVKPRQTIGTVTVRYRYVKDGGKGA
jgi:hypothetical protein